MEQQIARLEERVEVHSEQIAEVHAFMREIRDKLTALMVQVGAMKLCSAPDECLVIGERVQKHSERLRDIENERNYARGVVWAVGLIGSLVGTIATMLIGSWWRG